MQSERWQECLEIFGEAIERPHNARAALLERSCNGNEALRRRVELLLKYHDQSATFIDTPAFVTAPELLVDDPTELIGQHVGYYRIDSLLGAGGMGVVYLACDERLGRQVGLKVPSQSLLIDPARWERLKREARTASVLNHPNIMTIHEVGEIDSTHYIATEFIEGITLRERMSKGPILPNEALDIAIQVANALRVAHAAGIVHRDIKPENIMLRPDGYVKVLDFGIAKFSEETTQQGKILGTARYMSPEQAQNQTVDARSDLWSLGVVLYEMLSARPPFEGEKPTDVIAAVLSKEPPALHDFTPDLPPALQHIAERALRKDPAERYQSAEEMRSDLRAIKEVPTDLTNNRKRTASWIGIAAVAALFVGIAVFYGWGDRSQKHTAVQAPIEKGVAILPFENLSPEKADAFFAESVQDDVLTSVGKIKDLKVISRESVSDYQGKRHPGKVREIGQALGVSHVLEGSVRKGTDRVVVNVALIDTRDERQVWSERYERTITDAISLQGELAIEIARTLQAKLTPAEIEVVAEKPTQNSEAYLLYLRAREADIRSKTVAGSEGAAELYQRAIDLDPNFALAHARLSLCAGDVGLNLAEADVGPEKRPWFKRARFEADEALRLSPNLGEARLAMTHCYLWQDNDYDRALRELARTAELLPNSAEVPLTAAFVYKRQSKLRERLAALRRAQALDPRNIRVLSVLALTLRWVRDWPEAIQTFDGAAVMDPEKLVYGCWWGRANDEFRFSNDINKLKTAISEGPPGRPPDDLNAARYETAMLERDYPEAARSLSALSDEYFKDALLHRGNSKAFHEALIAVASNSNAITKETALEAARIDAKRRLEFGPFRNGDDIAHAELGLVYAFLGRNEEAINEGLRGVEACNEFTIIEKNESLSALALIYAQTGEVEKAIDLIEHQLTVPVDIDRGGIYNMTLMNLKWGWQWDPLRSNPRFQKILASPEPKTVY